MSHEFAPAVAAFVTEHVRTLAELQLLMLVIQSGDRWWDASSAANVRDFADAFRLRRRRDG